jgi:HK97 family phage major capsid protein
MNKRYQKLLQERADLVKQAKAIFNLAEQEGRDLTADEKATDDGINTRLEEIAGEIEREERRRRWEREVAAVPDANMTQAQRGIESVRDRREDDPRRGFADMADFALAVRAASHPGGYIDERLHIGAAPSNQMQSAGSSGEGYETPPAMREAIWELVFEEGNLINEVDNEPTSKNAVTLNADESTPWGSTGVQAYWRSQSSQMTGSKEHKDARLVKLHELYAFVLAEEELLEDAPRLADRLTRKSARAIDFKINQAFFGGTGAGQPLGWFTSGALVTVAKETSQTADTIVAANVAKMYARIINPSQSTWFVNQDAFPQLMTMTLGNQPIWTPPSTGFVNAPGGLLLGRPVRFSEQCETLGDKGDIQLVNPMGYYSPTKSGAPAFAESIHLYFDYNIKAFRWIFRIGGQPHLSAPVSPNKGSATRSHFVTLAARA